MSSLLKIFSPKDLRKKTTKNNDKKEMKISNGRNEVSRKISASRIAMIIKFSTHFQCYICASYQSILFANFISLYLHKHKLDWAFPEKIRNRPVEERVSLLFFLSFFNEN